jgi:hypothetical protein
MYECAHSPLPILRMRTHVRPAPRPLALARSPASEIRTRSVSSAEAPRPASTLTVRAGRVRAIWSIVPAASAVQHTQSREGKEKLKLQVRKTLSLTKAILKYTLYSVKYGKWYTFSRLQRIAFNVTCKHMCCIVFTACHIVQPHWVSINNTIQWMQCTFIMTFADKFHRNLYWKERKFRMHEKGSWTCSLQL